MAETKTSCACGGTFGHDSDGTGAAGDMQVCGGCGAVLETCIGCGKPATDWAINGKLCVVCGEGYVDGSININLSDTQQSRLLAWAEERGLLPF